MKNEDLTLQLSNMTYDELMDKVRAIRQARVTPSEPAKPKKSSQKQKTTEDKLNAMLADMSPDELADFLQGKT